MWTNSWPSTAGVGCGFSCIVAGENKCERSEPKWPPGDGEISRLGLRYLMDSGFKCSLHGARRGRQSRGLDEPVQGSG